MLSQLHDHDLVSIALYLHVYLPVPLHATIITTSRKTRARPLIRFG